MTTVGLFGQSGDAPFYGVGMGRITKVHPSGRSVDLLDLFSGSLIRGANLQGPELPPAFDQKELTGKTPKDAICAFYYLNNRPGRCIAVYLHGFDVDEDKENENYRYHWRIGGYRITMDKDGQEMVVEQTKSDGSAGPTVTMDGERVVIGDTATAKDVARKDDAVSSPLKNVVLTGSIAIASVPPVSGTATFTLGAVHNPLPGAITEGSNKLKIED
jgi:hypothetical protein